MRLAMFESKNRGVWFAWWLDGKDVNGGKGNELEGMKFKGGVGVDWDEGCDAIDGSDTMKEF